MTEDKIPEFLVELGQKIQAADMRYDTWILEHKDDLSELAKQYSK